MEANNVVRGTFAITSIQIVQYIAQGLFYVVVTKTGALTETDLGLVSILTFLGFLTMTLTSLSLPTALTKYVSENLKKNEKMQVVIIRRTVNTSVLVFATLGLAVTIFLSGQISMYFWKTETYAPLIVFMSIYAFFHTLMSLFNASLQAFFLFEKVAVVSLVWVVLSRFLGASLALLHFGVYGVVFGYVVGYGAAFVLSFLFGRGQSPRISAPSSYMPMKPLLKFSFPLFLSSIILLGMNWADIAVLASLTSNYAVLGIYYLAANSVTFISALYVPISYTVLPLLSAQNSVKDFQSINNTLTIAGRYLYYLMLPTCVGLAMIAPTAIRSVYGHQYVYGSVSFAILSLAQVLVAFYMILTTTLTAIGKTSDIMKINIVSVLSYIALLLVLVPIFTDIGAASARFTMQVISLALTIHVLNKNVKVVVDKESLWKSALASIAIVPILILTEHILASFSVYLILIVDVLAAASVYLVLLYLLKALNHQDFGLLKRTFPFIARYLEVIEGIMVRKT